MNPSYIAYNKALMATLINTIMGVEPPAPKAKKDPNVGAAFAKNVGIQQDEPSEEKEDKVRAHLDKLAVECKQRYLDGLDELPYVEEMKPFPVAAPTAHERYIETQIAFGHKKAEDYGVAKAHEDHAEYIDKQMILNRNIDLHTGREYLPDEPDPISYPRSDMIVLMEEEQERRAAIEALQKAYAAYGELSNETEFNTAADAKVMTALYGSDNGVKIDEITPHDKVIAELHKTHEAYIQRRIELNRMGENQRAMDACVHSGERGNLNYDNYTDEAL